MGQRIEFFPVAFFSAVMGLAGFAIAWQSAGKVLGAPAAPVGATLAVLSGVVFVVLAVLYGLKLLRHRAATLDEWRHPVKMSFGATVSVSLLLLAIVAVDSAPGLSLVLWFVGAGLHLAVTLYVLSVWMHSEGFEIHHINPAWFIPVVGNIVAPIAGVTHAGTEVSWFFFSIGVLFWIVLMTIIFYRMIFHNPLPARLVPTLFILVAPPAAGFIAYTNIIGGVDGFGRFLYYSALFLTLLLLFQIRRFSRLQFSLSWWAYSFPLAAMTIATLLMAHHTGKPAFLALGHIMLALLTLVIGLLAVCTVVAARRGEICVAEE